MTTRHRRGRHAFDQALLDNPSLGPQAPTTTPTRLDDLETTNLMAVHIDIHMDKQLHHGQAATPQTLPQDGLHRRVTNLLDNALKYTPAGGAVMLRVRRRASGEIELSITDTGPGVAAADRERVVERFVRLENSRNEPGAGLGLSLVAAVARAHGGRLELDEGPGLVDGKGPGLRAALVLPAG